MLKSVQTIVQNILTLAAGLQPRRVGLLTVGCIMAMLVVGCGSEGGAALSPTPTTVSQASAASQTGSEEFGLTSEQLVESIEKVESLIAECMAEAGFEYFAVDYKTFRRGMVSDKSMPGLSEREYFAQYGFGISTLYTGRPPQLAEEYTPAKIGLGERNVELFNNLSAADQVAYNRTLLGENSDATFAVALETEDFAAHRRLHGQSYRADLHT